jgi:hypothetical protein
MMNSHALFLWRETGCCFGKAKTLPSIFLFIVALCPWTLAESEDERTTGNKEYYSPADEFHGNPAGFKIIGKFRAEAFSNGGYYLQADSSRGEKDVMRSFVPRNDNINPGCTYTFTQEQPMVIVSKGLFGQYNVDLPDNLANDQVREQQVKREEQFANNNRAKLEAEQKAMLARIPPFARPLVERQKTATTPSSGGTNSFPKLGGFGKLAWGSDLETTVLLAEIDPGGITDIADYHQEYRDEPSDPQKRLQVHHRHVELMKKINEDTRFQMAGLQAVPDIGAVFGVQGDKTTVCLLSESKLYGIGILYPTGIMGEPVKTLTEALKMKYGNCSISSKKIGGRPWTSMHWKNEHGSVVLVLKPFEDFEMELRKVMLPAARAEMAAKTAELQAYGKNQLTDSIQQLSDGTMDAFQKMVEAYDKQIELGGLFYYDNSVLSLADEKKRALETVVNADQQSLEQREVQQRQKAASQLLDKI